MNKHEQALDILDRARILSGETMAWLRTKDIADTEVILTAFGLVLTRIFTSRVNKKHAEDLCADWIKTFECMVYNELRGMKDEGTEGSHGRST